MVNEAEVKFTEVHGKLVARLSENRESRRDLFQSNSELDRVLAVPLIEEQVETTVRKNGKQITEVLKIGECVAKFKTFMEEEEVKLMGYWKEWEEVQNEYLELGVDVFGRDAFGVDGKDIEAKERTFKQEMELLDLECKARVEELGEAIDDFVQKALYKMRSSEKVCSNIISRLHLLTQGNQEQDTQKKKEQQRLLHALMFD
jgi:phosphopantothenoylcysteine decarboxylase